MISNMSYNAQNAEKIDRYIQDNPDCKMQKDITQKLHGKMTDLKTYRIPLNLTFYNIKNGRFAAEYADLKKLEKRELDTTKPEDSKKIQDLLLEIDLKQSKILEEDVLQKGQREPGIITHDGYVINGNRRRAVLSSLVSVHGRSEFNFIEVARLPPNVTSQDLWKIEAGIQLSRSPQLHYGPINELLKFKEGFDADLSPKEIANELFGGFSEKDILAKLEEFKLIAEYLHFIQDPGVFNRAKGIHEHFIDLRKILSEFDKLDPDPDKMERAKRIGFQLIHDGVHARDFRKLKEILKTDAVRNELWTAEKYCMPEPLAIKDAKKVEAEKKDEYTDARIVFNNCMDSLKARSEAQQPEKLLQRALKNLENIDIESCDMSSPAISDLITKVQNALGRLQ